MRSLGWRWDKQVEGSFTVGPKPSAYRLTLVFRTKSDKRLGSLGRYFRVAAPTANRRLELNASSYRPEQTVFARVENFGTTPTRYGVPYEVERLSGDQWSRAPESPKGPWILPILISNPGRSGKCFSFWIPPKMPPGHYRIVKVVDRAFNPPTRSLGSETLTAEFEILP